MERFFLFTFALLFFSAQLVHADFINGSFEDIYTPDSTTCSLITGWTQTGYYFAGTGSNSPASISDINLQGSGGTNIKFCGVTDIVRGTTQSLNDYFLSGATPTPTLLLPNAGSQSAMVNLRSVDSPLTKVGSTHTVTGWTAIASQATSISQEITVQSSDIDSGDGKVHVRFLASAVLENPTHAANQQPFMAIQLNNITTSRTGTNPLFFEWNYGGQPGVPWQTLSVAGTNEGSSSDYQYTNWQAFDIAPGNAFIHVGDVIQLVAVSSGCALGGHDGHMYLDQVGTKIPSGLWITATGPISSTPGSNITYTYNYINNGSGYYDNVQVVASLPQQGTPATPPAASVTFVSVSTPTTGSCSGTSPVTCSLGNLAPGQTGSFQLTVNIPSGWATSTGPVNNGNYPISATGVSPLLGPLVQTALVTSSSLSNLVANTSGLQTTATIGVPYAGTYSCSNNPTSQATADASNASCDIANLPAGLSVTGCTISPSSATWSQPQTIPSTQTVTCSVSGTPTTIGAVTATVDTDATNNSNSTTNQANITITVSGASFSNLIASTSGMPTSGTVGAAYSGTFSCSNTPTTRATASAFGATCNIANLPPGLSVTGCTITPSGTSWLSPQTIPSGQTVTCTVSGMPTTNGSFKSTAQSNASNNSNSTSNTALVTITVSRIAVPATLNGWPVLSPAVACCGRPVILGDLPIAGTGPTTYTVTAHTGNATCVIGHIGTQTYLKMRASNKGSCTVVGTKNGISSAPFTVVAP